MMKIDACNQHPVRRKWDVGLKFSNLSRTNDVHLTDGIGQKNLLHPKLSRSIGYSADRWATCVGEFLLGQSRGGDMFTTLMPVSLSESSCEQRNMIESTQREVVVGVSSLGIRLTRRAAVVNATNI